MPGAAARSLRGPPPLPGAAARPLRGPTPLPGAAARPLRGPPPLPGAAARPLRGPPPLPGAAVRGPPAMLSMPRGRGPIKTTPILPEKKKVVPKIKMNGLFWSKMKFSSIEDFNQSVWSSLNDEKVCIDFTSFEREFGKHDKKKETVKKVKSMSRQQKVSLVEPKRQQNCGIALARFRLPYESLKRALLELDLTILTAERTQALINLVPSKEEIDLVNSFDGDKNMLMETEKFFLTVGSIPRLKFRLEALLSSFNFDQTVEELSIKLELLRKGTDNIKNSKKLPRVIEVILALGNYLNGDTARGGAYGFNLDALKKLSTVRTSDNKRNLLHWVSEQFENSETLNDLLNFEEELCDISGAASVTISQLDVDFRQLKNALKMVQREIDNANGAGCDIFQVEMKKFMVSASEKVDRFEKQFNAIWCEIEVLFKMWTTKDAKKSGGDDISTSFFAVFVEFVQTYVSSRKQNQAIKEQLAKEEAREKAALLRKKQKSSMREKADEDEKDLFGDFNDKMRQGPSAMIAEFRSRHGDGLRTASMSRSKSSGLKVAKSYKKLSGGSMPVEHNQPKFPGDAVRNEWTAMLGKGLFRGGKS